MRCPKCGYISFDTFGTCKKCNREIGKLLEELDGTVFEATAPSFLHIRPTDTLDTSEPEEVTVELLEEEQLDEGISMPGSFADGDVLTEDMDLDEGAVGVVVAETEEIEMKEEILLDEAALGENDSSADGEEQEADLELDFGDIDISDLAPPEAEQELELSMGETLSEEPVAAAEPASIKSTPAQSLGAGSSGLEDLQVEDLDLDVPAPLVSGSKIGEKLMPSVKTGTALDDFDIDLGELISKEK